MTVSLLYPSTASPESHSLRSSKRTAFRQTQDWLQEFFWPSVERMPLLESPLVTRRMWLALALLVTPLFDLESFHGLGPTPICSTWWTCIGHRPVLIWFTAMLGCEEPPTSRGRPKAPSRPRIFHHPAAVTHRLVNLQLVWHPNYRRCPRRPRLHSLSV